MAFQKFEVYDYNLVHNTLKQRPQIRKTIIAAANIGTSRRHRSSETGTVSTDSSFLTDQFSILN